MRQSPHCVYSRRLRRFRERASAVLLLMGRAGWPAAAEGHGWSDCTTQRLALSVSACFVYYRTVRYYSVHTMHLCMLRVLTAGSMHRCRVLRGTQA